MINFILPAFSKTQYRLPASMSTNFVQLQLQYITKTKPIALVLHDNGTSEFLITPSACLGTHVDVNIPFNQS